MLSFFFHKNQTKLWFDLVILLQIWSIQFLSRIKVIIPIWLIFYSKIYQSYLEEGVLGVETSRWGFFFLFGGGGGPSLGPSFYDSWNPSVSYHEYEWMVMKAPN